MENENKNLKNKNIYDYIDGIIPFAIISLITAIIYNIGYVYLYGYFQVFNIEVNSLNLSTIYFLQSSITPVLSISGVYGLLIIFYKFSLKDYLVKAGRKNYKTDIILLIRKREKLKYIFHDISKRKCLDRFLCFNKELFLAKYIFFWSNTRTIISYFDNQQNIEKISDYYIINSLKREVNSKLRLKFLLYYALGNIPLYLASKMININIKFHFNILSLTFCYLLTGSLIQSIIDINKYIFIDKSEVNFLNKDVIKNLLGLRKMFILLCFLVFFICSYELGSFYGRNIYQNQSFKLVNLEMKKIYKEDKSNLNIKNKKLVFLIYANNSYYLIEKEKSIPKNPKIYIVPKNEIKWITMQNNDSL